MNPPPSSSDPDADLDYGPTLRGLRAGWKVFERYTLVRQLGRGGMGVVWLARDEKLDLDIALKFLPENLVHDEIALDDLRRETKRCMRLTHQHIVHVYDFVSDEDRAAIAMEFVEGKSLSALRLEQPGKVFEVEQLRALVRQVCEALTYAHEQGRLVHYDLKPGNLMLTGGGLVKVMDFGIAASIHDSASRQSRARSTAGMGTLHYMSPQQLGGYPPAVSDDVYSLGATMYELLSGRPPFHGFRDRALEEQIQHTLPPSLAQRRTELAIESTAAISPLWEQTIAACLEKEPEKRPRSVAEVWQRLSGAAVAAGQAVKPAPGAAAQKPQVPGPAPSLVSNSSSQIPHPSSPISRSRKLALAALVCVGGVLGWRYGYEQPRQERQRLDEMARQSGENRAMEVATLVAAGRTALGAEDYNTARAKLEAALTLESGNGEAVRLLEQVKSGEQKRQQEQMAAAELAKKKSEATALVSEALRLYNRKDYEGARQKISAALVLVPGDSAAVNLRAEVEAAEEQSKQQMAGRNAGGNDFNSAQIGDTRVVDLGSGVKLTLCYIPAGSFTMGSPASEAGRENDEDQVQVRISKGFWLAKTECTQAQWRGVMGTEPSKLFKGDDLPVESVSWEDAQGFMAKLNSKNVLPAGWKWSLPSEAQWEYACRAGTTTAYAGELERMAWYSENSGSTAHVVGTKAANGWGLQDMQGNVSEWCSDWYANKLPGGTDPMGASSGSFRVIRGGSWYFLGRLCRSALRSWYDPGLRDIFYGFRAASVPAER
jgi:formylglycine-generating enzyme required for sulfatase activity/serine/threonine protein kinase